MITTTITRMIRSSVAPKPNMTLGSASAGLKSTNRVGRLHGHEAGDLQGVRHPRTRPRGARRDAARSPSAARSRASSDRARSRSAATCASHAPALTRGARGRPPRRGCDVVDIGLVATPMLYFAIDDARRGRRRDDHRVPQSRRLQRLQAVRAQAVPIGSESACARSATLALALDGPAAAARARQPAQREREGSTRACSRSGAAARCAR